MSVQKKHGESFQDDYFGDSKEAAEGFKNDNPLANSDNYEVYMSDVSKQDNMVVSYAERPGRCTESQQVRYGSRETSDKCEQTGWISFRQRLF